MPDCESVGTGPNPVNHPGAVMTHAEFHWLVGLLEGEGSFLKGPPCNPYLPVLSIESTDEDIVARVASLLGRAYSSLKSRRGHWKPSFRTVLKGRKAVDLKKLQPLMGARRQQQIEEAVGSYQVRSRIKLTARQVVAIKRRLRKGEKQGAL